MYLTTGLAVIQEQGSRVTESTECDTNDEISLGEVGGCTVSNETHNTMPSAQLLPLNTIQYIEQEPLEDRSIGAEAKEQYIKEVEDTWEYYRVSNAGEYVAMNYEIIDKKDSWDSATEEQMPNKCIGCDKRFSSSISLRKHMVDSHADKKNFTCTLCDKYLANIAGVHHHMLAHMKYLCTKCGQSLSISINLSITGGSILMNHAAAQYVRNVLIVQQI